MDYDCIVFDTAPTGHTLRLLQFPNLLQKGLDKLMGLRGMLGGALDGFGALMGGGFDEMQNELMGKMQELKVRNGPCGCLRPLLSLSPLSLSLCVCVCWGGGWGTYKLGACIHWRAKSNTQASNRVYGKKARCCGFWLLGDSNPGPPASWCMEYHLALSLAIVAFVI
jgi:hypothetical protein